MPEAHMHRLEIKMDLPAKGSGKFPTDKGSCTVITGLSQSEITAAIDIQKQQRNGNRHTRDKKDLPYAICHLHKTDQHPTKEHRQQPSLPVF